MVNRPRPDQSRLIGSSDCGLGMEVKGEIGTNMESNAERHC